MEKINKQHQNITKKQEFINFIKFILFSISACLVQVAVFAICNEFIFNDANNEYGVSYFVALFIAVLWNFVFNRKFTFKSANNVKVAMLLVLAFYIVFTPLSIWWGVALTNAGWNDYLVLVLTLIINVLLEFIYNRYVVYKNSINSAVKDNNQKNK